MPSSSGSSQSRNQTRISCIADRLFTPEPLRKHAGFIYVHVGFPGGTSDQDTHTGEGSANALRYSCLGNPQTEALQSTASHNNQT